jgi:hypothetical protein
MLSFENPLLLIILTAASSICCLTLSTSSVLRAIRGINIFPYLINSVILTVLTLFVKQK